MLFIVFDDDRAIKTWHINQKLTLHSTDIYRVVEVQADGDELDFIRSEFDGIPTTEHKVVHWYGDYAKFIVGGLR